LDFQESPLSLAATLASLKVPVAVNRMEVPLEVEL
jgi:hypothetical protein